MSQREASSEGVGATATGQNATDQDATETEISASTHPNAWERAQLVDRFVTGYAMMHNFYAEPPQRFESNLIKELAERIIFAPLLDKPVDPSKGLSERDLELFGELRAVIKEDSIKTMENLVDRFIDVGIQLDKQANGT